MQVVLPECEARITFDVGPGSLMDDREFFEFCARNRSLRIERETGGAILIAPAAGFETGYRNNEICRQLGNWAKTDGRGVAPGSNTEYLLPDGSARAPDAAWVLKSRLAAFTREQKERFLPLCPDFVVELTSPSDRLSKVMAKMGQGMENGAGLGWLVDATQQTVLVYRPGQDPEQLVHAGSVSGEGPVAGFRLELGDIWRGVE